MLFIGEPYIAQNGDRSRLELTAGKRGRYGLKLTGNMKNICARKEATPM